MDNLLLSDMIVCKICERQVNAKWLYAHSSLCKDAAEMKEIVIKQQYKLSQLVKKAYDLRNQLNTNFAIQKLKQSRRNSQEFEENPMEVQRSNTSLSVKKHQKFVRFDFIAEKVALETYGSQTPQKDYTKKKSRRDSDKKIHEYEEEFIRACIVLKSIIQYGNNSKINTIDVECDITNDFKIKNEVNVLYVAIKDKMISDYLQQFLENIQLYIKEKQKYLKKLEELERQEYNTSSFRGSEDSFSSDNTRFMDFPVPHPLKAFRMISLDDSDASEMGCERKTRLPDSRWLRRGSTGNTLPPKSCLPVPNGRRNMTTLSKFASPLLRQGSQISQESQESPKSAGSAINLGGKRRKIPKKLLDDLLSMQTFQSFRKPSRLFNSRNILHLKDESKGNGENKKRDFKRNQTIHINPYANLASDPKTMAFITEDPTEEGKIKSEAARLNEMRKKRMSWNHLVRDVDIKKLLNKPEILEVCPEEDLPAGADNNEDTPGSRKDGHHEEGPILSKGDLSSSDESTSEYSEESEESEESDDEFPKVTMKGYYSDSEVTNMRRGEQCKRTNEVNIDDFSILKFIGEGAYGKIYLVKKKATGDIYAMKIVNFEDRESTHNKISSLRAESDVYKSIKGDWVVKAYYTFSYESYVCFVLEYMLGGDLQGLLEQVGCFEECVAQFYFAELLLAVESLHCLGIVHRDLKPDNVLIDATGHIKLTDFGLSEKGVVKLRQRTSTIRTNTLSSLTHNNSIHESPQKIYNSITKDILSQLQENIVYGRTNSIEQAGLIGLDPDMIPSPTTIRKIASTISDLSPFHGEPYIMKNKNDEEVVFTFLNNQEKCDSWMSKKKIVKSEHSNGSNRKKELNRIIGTPDYMAPEIIKGSDCSDRSVDLWSLGVILYEFLVGVPPFNDDSMEKIFDNIVNFRLDWPNIGYEEDCVTPEAADLIKKLMNPDPKKRISLPEVKKHAFFKDFDFCKVKDLPAPVIPKKKDFESHSPMGLHNVFFDKLSDEVKKDQRRGAIFNEDIGDFQMKRIDLLHQLNQTVYKAHILNRDAQKEKDKSN